jgi:GTPase SAR1 family protein
VAILVYDITRKESFEEIKDFWYNQLKQNMKDKSLIIAVAANKSDMIELEDTDEIRPKKFADVKYK